MYLYLHLYLYLRLCLTLCSCICIGAACAHFTYARFKETAAGEGAWGKGRRGNLKLNLKVADEVVVLSRLASESNEKLLRNA